MHKIIHHEKQQCVVCRQWRNGNQRTCVCPPLEIYVALQSMTSGLLGVVTLTQCCCEVICCWLVTDMISNTMYYVTL